MRKNIYDENILMVNRGDIQNAIGSIEILTLDEANILRLYSKLIDEVLSCESKARNMPSYWVDSSKEFGILINTSIMEKLKEHFVKVSSENEIL